MFWVGVRKRTAHVKNLFVDYQTHKGMYPWLRTNLEKHEKLEGQNLKEGCGDGAMRPIVTIKNKRTRVVSPL